MRRGDLARLIVGGVVTAVWATGYVLSYLPDSKVQAPAEMTPIMLGVLAFLSAERIKAAANGVRKGMTDEPQ